MRIAWTFFAGLVFTGFVLLVNLPLFGGAAIVARLLKGESWTVLSGQSVFAVRDDGGRISGQAANVDFHMASVPVAGSPRSRRLLLRSEVLQPDLFADRKGAGRVRLDAWTFDGPDDLKQKPLYSILSPGRGASMDEDGTITIDRGTRRSVHALSSGAWLFDADTAQFSFTVEGEQRRYLALAVAEEDLPAGSVAVLTYASPQAPLRRLLVMVSNAERARVLKSSISMARLSARTLDDGRKVAELPLTAGTIRIPIEKDGLTVNRASLPSGFSLIEMAPWGRKPQP
jgi:hypothetical protein